MADEPEDPVESQETDQPHRKSCLGRIFGLALFLIGCVAWLWAIGAVFYFPVNTELLATVQKITTGFVAVVIPILWWQSRNSGILKKIFPLAVVVGVMLFLYTGIQPTHDRDWTIAQKVLPSADFDESGESVSIKGIRSFRYGPQPSESTYDDRYDLRNLQSVWFGVDRFTDFEPMAHTFLSFGFADGTHRNNYLAFSVETRRENDENSYSPVRGLYKNYEVIYVVADEQDVLSVRSDVREHVVQLYPIKATPEQMKALFVDILNRTNQIQQQPEWYHTLKSNCTNNLVHHTNKLLNAPISSWQRGVVFPGYSDWLAMQLGLLDTALPLEEAREHFRIDELTKSYDGKSDFSEYIRSGLKNEPNQLKQ